MNYFRKEKTRKIKADLEELIAIELRNDKKLIEDYKISTVSTFNFNAIRDEILRKYNKKVSAGTIRNRAINWNFWIPKDKKEKSFIEFETGGFGVLWQHDTSVHKWSPYMDKFYLILTIDDHSRYFVYANFFKNETSMTHIYAMQDAILCYGIPLKYYVDRHSIFTGHDRKGIWQKQKKKAEEFEVEFKKVCDLLGVQLIKAGSANAKGKIERPFRYLQDRLCRRLAKEEVRDIKDANKILKQEIEYYNCHKIHSTIKEIPLNRLNKSIKEKTSTTRSCNFDKINLKDIFCLHHKRSVDKFHRISYNGHKIKLQKVRYMQRVEVNVRTDEKWKYLRIFANKKYIKNVMLPLKKNSQ